MGVEPLESHCNRPRCKNEYLTHVCEKSAFEIGEFLPEELGTLEYNENTWQFAIFAVAVCQYFI